jgi:hypothetical protein
MTQGMDRMFFTFRYVFKIIFFIIIGLYASVWLLSPWVANHYLGQYLEPHGLFLSDDTSIRYNPFRSRLEINTLQINNAAAEKVSVLSFFSVEVDLHQLMFDDIYVPYVVIKGLDVSIRKMQDDVLVGGISLAKFKNNNQFETPKSETPKDVAINADSSFLNRLVMPDFILEESNVDFYNDQTRHQLKLHNIKIIDFFATSRKQTVGLSIIGELDNGPININMTADLINQEGGINFDVNISNIDVERFSSFLPKDIDTLLGVLSYKGKHSLKIEGDSIVLNVEKGRFSGSDVNLGKGDVHLLLGQQEINIDGLVLILEKNKKPKIEGNGSVIIDDINVYNKDKAIMLAAIKQLALGSVTLFNDEEGVQRVNVGQIDLVDSFFSDDQGDAVPALVKFTLLKIQDVGLSQYGIELGDISLAGLVANAELDENKKVRNLVAIPTAGNGETVVAENTTAIAEGSQAVVEDPQVVAGTGIAAEAEVKTKPPFKVKLNSFSLVDTAKIFFIDQSVDPVYQQDIAINKLTAGPFDNTNPDQESVISIAGNSDRYATFSFVTKAKPFLEKPTYKIDGDFKEFSLPGLSSYIKQFIPYEIESGQLDLGIDVQLTGTAVNGEVQVMLRGIELTSADDFEVSSLNDQISVPFNMALGMLKDSDGNVELSLPITGDTRSPSFGLSGFVALLVKKATILGARDYLVTTFVPYAQVVNIVVLAGGYALKVRVNDLPYDPQQTAFQPEQQEFLKQFSALLKDSDSTQVKLCAIATAKDIGKAPGSDLTSPEDRKRLKEISTQRVSIFKAYMIEEENVPSSRLLLCTPQIDSSMGAVPRLSFKT